MDALEFRIERALNYIIKKTFPDDDDIPYMKLTFMKKDTSSFHGDYNTKTGKARVGNLSRPPVNILVTLLHEAAHHCEYSMTGCTGHQKSFYVIYNRLMRTAIIAGFFSYDMAKTVTDSASMKQLEKYCGPVKEVPIPEKRYKKDKCLIYAFDSYRQKDKLAERGYHFNARAKAWELQVDKKDKDNEVAFLKELSPDITVMAADDIMDLTILATVCVTGKTYQKKDVLASLNFRYMKELPNGEGSGWFKRIRSTQLPELKKAMDILSNTPGITVSVKY